MLALKEKKPVFCMYDDDTVKWEHEGKRYCLHVWFEENPLNPRRDWDNITTMACWHPRYRLGDEKDDKEPEDFWRRLVRENVPEAEILAAAEAGKIKGVRLAKGEDGLIDIYETAHWKTVIGNGEPEEYLEYQGVARDSVAYYLLDDLTVRNCMGLLEPYAEWMPLWLYDHSGITMSCGARTGQYADRWDSSCVGWIVALKSTIMRETVDYVLDENGQKIKVEYKHEGQPSTWSYLTKPLTEETWRNRAIEIMEDDVKVYDLYLTGQVYGYTIHEWDEAEQDWDDGDSCGGFFDCDILENGICDEAGRGLEEAILAGQVTTGKATKKTRTYWEF